MKNEWKTNPSFCNNLMKLMCLESDDQWLLTLQKKRWKKLKRHSYEIIHHHRGSSFENSGKKIKPESDQAS